ncbi:methylenetetrahydrofolate reductase C-terminal domain-containing protein [Chloroflexota bacterium]
MIIAERKDPEEIKRMIAPYKNVLIVGCESCVNICWAGGEKEVKKLAEKLGREIPASDISINESTVERQCEKEMVEYLAEQVEEVDAVLSMACGVGAQVMASVFEDKPVLPALNTTFLGYPAEPGTWVENCGSCGDCVLDRTGAICPVACCAKGLLNGPCGGVRKGGMCEVDAEKDCTWVRIYNRLEKQDRLDLMEEYTGPKNYRVIKRPGIIKASEPRGN